MGTPSLPKVRTIPRLPRGEPSRTRAGVEKLSDICGINSGCSRLCGHGCRCGTDIPYRRWRCCRAAHTFKRSEKSRFIKVPVILAFNGGSSVFSHFGERTICRCSAQSCYEIIDITAVKHIAALL